jgi:hypothetical protein
MPKSANEITTKKNITYDINITELTPILPPELIHYGDLWQQLNRALDKGTFDAKNIFLWSWQNTIWTLLPICLLLIGISMIVMYDVISGLSVICVMYICFYRDESQMKKLFESYRYDTEKKLCRVEFRKYIDSIINNVREDGDIIRYSTRTGDISLIFKKRQP